MSLTDLMSGSGLAIYAEIALILFLAAFLALVIRLFARRHRPDLDAAARLPLEDDRIITPRRGAPHDAP